MSNEKNMQRKWDREEVIILVTEYYKNRNLPEEKIDESYHRISKFLRQREELCTGKSVSDMLEIMQEYVCNQHVYDVWIQKVIYMVCRGQDCKRR